MPNAQPFVREAGSGPSVICIHSNASSSTQWRGLMDMLSADYDVLAPDSYGSGKSPDWLSDRFITLSDEVALIEPVLAAAGSPLTLIGHSYGAAVALLAAVRNPSCVRAIVIYEPTLFAHEESQTPSPIGVDGIRNAVAASSVALDQGDNLAAAEHFIDFWMGSGSWAQTPSERKPSIANSVVNVRRWSNALFTEPTPLAAFQALKMPVLYILGEKSPESAHAVARRLVPILPNVKVVTFEGLGHMAPITHPETINNAMISFLKVI
jgi:pimeloyl-ACP methyl ester carboxylesterase